MRFSAVEIGPYRLTQAVHERAVPLGALHKKLRGVVALAPETMLLGNAGGRAAVLGALPNAGTTISEVETLVRSLLAHDAIELDGGANAADLAARHGVDLNATDLSHVESFVAGMLAATKAGRAA